LLPFAKASRAEMFANAELMKAAKQEISRSNAVA
jgi:hypothetical protein